MPTPQSSLGPVLVGLGLLLVVVGLVAWTGGLSWFGRLPGDIRVDHQVHADLALAGQHRRAAALRPREEGVAELSNLAGVVDQVDTLGHRVWPRSTRSAHNSYTHSNSVRQ